MNTIGCADCGDVVRAFVWQNPRSCRCRSMVVHRGLARYATVAAVPAGAELLRATHPAPVAEVLRVCVDNDGTPRAADPTPPASGQANEHRWSPILEDEA